MIAKIRNWYIAKRYLLRRRFKVYAWQFEGKKYLAIKETGWRGVKWERWFEIAHELDAQGNIIPFDGKEAIRLSSKM